MTVPTPVPPPEREGIWKLRDGEFVVSQVDLLKIRSIELGIPFFDQVPKTAIENGAVVVVLDGMGDPVGTPVFTCKQTGESVGEPALLAVQEREIGVGFTNGLGFVNMINQAPLSDGRLVPVLAESITADSAAVTLASDTSAGYWALQGHKDCFGATDAGIVVADLALPEDPSKDASADDNEVPGEWKLYPSVGTVAADGTCAVTLLFTPDDTGKFAPLVVVVPIAATSVTEERAIEVTPVTDYAQLTKENTNGITLEVPAEKLSLGLTWTGDSTTPPVVSTTTVTQTILATEGDTVTVPEAEIQALGYEGLTGDKALVAVLIEVPAGADTIVITDTESGGIGIDNVQEITLTKSNLLNGHTCHLLTPVDATINAPVRTVAFKEGSDTLRTHVLTIDVSAILHS